MKPRLTKIMFDILGLICCIVPPAACTCAYFPLWRETVGDWQMVGGTAVVLAIIVFVVISKYIKSRMRTPSPVVIALAAWLTSEVVYKVIDQLRVITLWMFIGCAIGAVFFWLAEQAEKKEKE